MFVRCLAWLFIAAVAVGLSAPQAQAADGATGTIEGRVLNLSNGRYLGKALVKVDGTNIETLTNDFGEYTLREVPVGDVKITVTFTGQEPKTADVKVEAGKIAEQDVGLNQAKGIAEDGTIILDAYVVEQQRYKNAQEIAANEERNSVTPKNVVSADMFGDIAEGNVGEFVKFLPGVQVEYGGTAYSNAYDATGISIRGFGAQDTAITLDNVPIANASPGSLTRQIGLDMMSINNASRVEIIKVPTPDMPANSMGGAVNLVSKTAFEYTRPTINWRVFGTFDNTVPLSLNKTPGPSRDKTLKFQPGAELSVAFPVTKNFGFTVTASSANQYNTLKRGQSTWSANLFTLQGDKPWTGNDPLLIQGTNATSATAITIVPLAGVNYAGDLMDLGHPALTRVQITDNPRMSNRHSGSLKLDWKPWRGHVVSGMYQVSKYNSVDVAHRFGFSAPKPIDWSATHTSGLQYRNNVYATIQPYFNISTGTMMTPVNNWATGSNGGRIRGDQGGNAASMDIDSRDRIGITHTGGLTYSFEEGPWKIFAAASISKSDGRAVDKENGHFSKVEMKIDPGVVNFKNIVNGIPSTVEVYRRPTSAEMPAITLPFATQDAAYNAFYSNPANMIDYTKLSNWVTNNFKGFSADAYSQSRTDMYKIDVRRELDFLPLRRYATFALKIGSRRDIQEDTKWGRGTGFRRSLRTGAPTLPSADYLDTGYIDQSPGFGFAPMQWPDTYKLFDLDQQMGLFRPESEVYGNTKEEWEALAVGDLTTTNQDARDNYQSWINQNKKIKETKTAYYIQLEGQAWNNRIGFVGGARREDSKREGYQPWTDTRWNFIRYADGTMFRETVGGVSYSRGVMISNNFNASDARTNLFAPDSNATAAAARDALRARLTQLGIAYPTSSIGSSTLRGLLMRLNPRRPIYAKQDGKPNYSASISYKITDELTARVSWSRSFGQIKLEDSTGGVISGSASTLNIEEYEEPGNPETTGGTDYRQLAYTTLEGWVPAKGTIKIGNPNLKPWISDNMDYSLSYNHRFEGKVTVSYYRKTVKNMHNSLVIYEEMPEYAEILQSLGIDFNLADPNDSYHHWKIESTVNGVGTAKTHGVEIDVQQRFGFLGNWGKYFSAFGSYSRKWLENPQSRTMPHPLTGEPMTVSSSTIASSSNNTSGLGLLFSNGRVTASVKATYRDRAYANTRSDAYYEGDTVRIFDYYPSEWRLDTSLSVAITPKYSFFANARDILNAERKTVRYDELGVYPEYARTSDVKKFGVQINCGIRGEF